MADGSTRINPLTRVDMFDPSIEKIDKFPVILTGQTGSTRPKLDPGTKMRPERVKFTSLVRKDNTRESVMLIMLKHN